MKTLEAFWRWVDNEKPRTLTIIQKACGSKALTPLARTAIDCAADVVCEMHKGAPPGFSLRYAFDWHRDDLRDVSFALLPALEKVLERRDAQDLAKLERDIEDLGGPLVLRRSAPAPECVAITIGGIKCTRCNFIYELTSAAVCPCCGHVGAWLGAACT